MYWLMGTFSTHSLVDSVVHTSDTILQSSARALPYSRNAFITIRLWTMARWNLPRHRTKAKVCPGETLSEPLSRGKKKNKKSHNAT